MMSWGLQVKLSGKKKLGIVNCLRSHRYFNGALVGRPRSPAQVTDRRRTPSSSLPSSTDFAKGRSATGSAPPPSPRWGGPGGSRGLGRLVHPPSDQAVRGTSNEVPH